jgi:2-polyprenyl-3-methyl-5-hydroxy-6-metoxy-1,4-benzoquinol methylase
MHKREAAFHDEWARATALDERSVRASFECATALENKFILEQMGPLRGKRLLDLGAGLGESSVYFAMQGAEVTIVDLSPEMVRTAVQLGRQNGVTLEGVVSSGEQLNVPANSYDLVYAANTIHHVEDRAALFGQISRALNPGGRFFSIDPISYNPVIGLYRTMANKVRTPDESPLTRADIGLARRYFQNVEHRHFWLLGLALFLKYFLLDRVHPNADRYWKRIYRETEESLRWWSPLRRLDSHLTRLPGLRWLAWNVVMYGEKPEQV